MEEFKIFTQKLAEFFKEELSASDETCREIEEMESFYEIRNFFEESDEIKEVADVADLASDVDRLEDEVSDLEKQIKSLEGEILDLEHELEAKIFHPLTYWDEEKYQLFLKYHDKFTSSEFESLMTK